MADALQFSDDFSSDNISDWTFYGGTSASLSVSGGFLNQINSAATYWYHPDHTADSATTHSRFVLGDASQGWTAGVYSKRIDGSNRAFVEANPSGGTIRAMVKANGSTEHNTTTGSLTYSATDVLDFHSDLNTADDEQVAKIWQNGDPGVDSPDVTITHALSATAITHMGAGNPGYSSLQFSAGTDTVDKFDDWFFYEIQAGGTITISPPAADLVEATMHLDQVAAVTMGLGRVKPAGMER